MIVLSSTATNSFISSKLHYWSKRSSCQCSGKDLTSKFMQFPEDSLTNKKEDPQHNPMINSCLVRIPGTLNSKCKEEVKIIQKWDGYRPQINYLLRDFRRWLINEKLEQQK
ncbi:MAG TPA: hypothetical protein VNB67_03925 [Nitrososphaeraceae archaeon]|nr:hypothetical protein [Nitrososphaeraceae archaeon]